MKTVSAFRVSRRSLMKSGAALAGAAALGGTFPNIVRAQGSGTLRVLLAGDPFYYAIEGLKDQFQQETGITLEIEAISTEALQARLTSSFISNEPDADVISVDQMWLGQYLESKWILPLNEFIKADSDTAIDDFIPEVLYSMNTWRGQVGTLPVASYGQMVLYRKDFVDEAGIKIPEDGSWTWSDYLDTVKALHGKSFGGTTMSGTVLAGQQPAPVVHMFTQLAASMGTRWFKSFPTGSAWDFTPTVDSPENREALKLFLELYKLSPAESVGYNWFDAGMRFAKGDIGMFYWWTPYAYLCRKDGYMTGKDSVVADKLGIVRLPKAPDHHQVVSLGGHSLGIAGNTGKREAAWQFVKWATSAKTQKAMALYDKYGYQFSDFARPSLYADPDLLKIYPYLPGQIGDIRAGNGKIVRPPCPVYTTLEGIYGLNLNKVLTGAMTPEACLSETSTFFETILKGNFLIPYQQASYDDTLEATKALMASLA
ncbi:extracellular solute-binding protein [Prosthecomicrobium pneumaticum]|uniref:Multiple sugar transport system substrate-binding protein n=1 Tax=Prosthecomicrobium pneumaticum TaxID=81895 RepID=A0A7W9FQA2_9HYPH|nr:extracellular solute-binding protein [Prosthecomicrobium pneumaticum]MBB5754844.1 multiple sugar transport system substrate-binding protein [Prosthecomicrobium pneumaticum]